MISWIEKLPVRKTERRIEKRSGSLSGFDQLKWGLVMMLMKYDCWGRVWFCRGVLGDEGALEEIHSAVALLLCNQIGRKTEKIEASLEEMGIIASS
ncbi:unnamed protein product [Lactuca virosa]|uniref:Uncharacterized protein n=1 Tax=Lactuca virosa TaxID=75947 RepID=A0AAU9NLQ7_9ASTR|nr:unnamed protein product [Lactuca virosa]